MAEKHLNKCTNFLVIWEMQIKTALRFHLTPIRMAKIKTQVTADASMRRKNTPPLLVGLQAGTVTLEINLLVPQKIRNSSTWRPLAQALKSTIDKWNVMKLQSFTTIVPLLGICPKDVPYTKGICSPTFIETLFIIARSCQQPRYPSTEEWIQKMCIYKLEYYSATKNGDFMKFLDK